MRKFFTHLIEHGAQFGAVFLFWGVIGALSSGSWSKGVSIFAFVMSMLGFADLYFERHPIRINVGAPSEGDFITRFYLGFVMATMLVVGFVFSSEPGYLWLFPFSLFGAALILFVKPQLLARIGASRTAFSPHMHP